MNPSTTKKDRQSFYERKGCTFRGSFMLIVFGYKNTLQYTVFLFQTPAVALRSFFHRSLAQCFHNLLSYYLPLPLDSEKSPVPECEVKSRAEQGPTCSHLHDICQDTGHILHIARIDHIISRVVDALISSYFARRDIQNETRVRTAILCSTTHELFS